MAMTRTGRGIRAVCRWTAVGMALSALACDASSGAETEPKPSTLADTINLGGQGGPLVKSGTVDWVTAGRPGPDGFAGNFARAQGLMLSLATSAYDDGDTRNAEVSELGFNITSSVHSGDNGPIAKSVDAFTATDVAGRMNVVAVRGSQEAQDFVTDFAGVAPTFHTSGPYGDYTLHVGFSRYADLVYQQLLASVQDSCQGDRKPLWLTGHSLGGAAATILAYKFVEAGCNVAGVSVFGSPSAGLSDWQSVYAATGLNPITQRWNNGQDPMVCLPPGGGWKHVGTENHVDHGSVRLDVHELPGMCNTTGLIGAVKSSLVVTDLPIRFTGAANDWLTGLIELSLLCDDGVSWDDVLTLGQCRVVDETNRLIQVYNISPNDFLVSAIGYIAYRSNHQTSSYQGGLGNIDYPSSAPSANLHVVITGSPDVVAQFYGRQVWVTELTQTSICRPLRAPTGEVFCDFRVADGYQAELGVNLNETLDLSPAQAVNYGSGPKGCSRIEYATNDDALVKCFRDIHGDTTIEVALEDWTLLL